MSTKKTHLIAIVPKIYAQVLITNFSININGFVIFFFFRPPELIRSFRWLINKLISENAYK